MIAVGQACHFVVRSYIKLMSIFLCIDGNLKHFFIKNIVFVAWNGFFGKKLFYLNIYTFLKFYTNLYVPFSDYSKILFLSAHFLTSKAIQNYDKVIEHF